jgi:hypothetical protein
MSYCTVSDVKSKLANTILTSEVDVELQGLLVDASTFVKNLLHAHPYHVDVPVPAPADLVTATAYVAAGLFMAKRLNKEESDVLLTVGKEMALAYARANSDVVEPGQQTGASVPVGKVGVIDED